MRAEAAPGCCWKAAAFPSQTWPDWGMQTDMPATMNCHASKCLWFSGELLRQGMPIQITLCLT